MTAPAKRVVWVTGASTGIGRALAEEHAMRGDAVFATARRKDKLEELQERIRAAGGFCEIECCDVQDEHSVAAATVAAAKTFGRVDVLVNNAGVTYFKEFLKTTVEEFDHVVGTNLRGMFLVTQFVLPAMVRERRGLIVNILSFSAKDVYEKSAVYSASKAGAEAMMNVLRSEVRRQGVRIVNVYPGAVLTPMWHASHQEKYGSQMLAPRDVARMVYEVSIQPEPVMVEELIIRPQEGDLHV